ncbi:type VII secretion integral membrane protein EccD [Actinomycetes bacterium KLBMP 9797]
MAAGLARVTISTPRRRLDVALPAHVPLAELLPEVLRHAGDGLADEGERQGGWVLRRADGAALVVDQALHPQGVRDGALLFLVPGRLQWTGIRYDDVVEAIADAARRRGVPWSAPATRVAGLAVGALLAAAGLYAVLRGGTAALPASAAVLLLAAGAVAARAHRDGVAGAALGGYALPYAFAGGLLTAPPDPGAAALIGGSAGLLGAALAGAALVPAYPRVFAAGGMIGLLGGLAGLAGLGLTVAGAAALLLTVLVCGIGLLPLAAIRLGRLPLPSVPPPPGPAPAELGLAPLRPSDQERIDPARVVPAVARADEVLTGALAGYAVLAVGAALVLVRDGGTAGRLLVAVGAGALLLRARLFAAVRQRVPLVAAGLAAVAVLTVWLLAAAGLRALHVAAGLAVLGAVASVAAGGTYAKRPPSPYVGRAAELLDTATVVAVVPITFAVLDLYGLARTLVGS